MVRREARTGLEITSGRLRQHRPQLDGLRAIAVAAVAWSHWEPESQFGIPFGTGVHLFFVLSGFLITTILLDIRAASDRRAAVGSFYIRRALRIFPAFYLTLLLGWLGDVPLVRESLAWQMAYLSNVWIFLADRWPGSISHLWSLAVEEQFYLAWPWLIVFAPRRWLLPAILASVAAAPVFRWMLATDGHRESMLAILTPGCLDSLGMGALVAWLALGSPLSLRQPRFSRGASAAGLSWTALLVAEAAGAQLPIALIAIKQTLQAVVFAWIVMRAAEGFDGTLGRFLSAGPTVYVGHISYGLYLAHGFAGDLLATFGISSASLPEPFRLLVLAAVTFAAAALSWHLLERPLNALKSRVPYAGLSRAAAPA